jgi:subtilase family serine protease
MEKNNKKAIASVVAILLFSVAPITLAQTTSTDYALLPGTASYLPSDSQNLGPVPSDQLFSDLILNFKAEYHPPGQQLTEQLNNASSQSITPQEYGELYGATDQEIATTTQWLSGNGFTGITVANGKNWITFSGTAGQVESAFHLQINNYLIDGNECYATPDNQSVPASLASFTIGIESLSNCFPPQPQTVSSKSSLLFGVPDDLLTIVLILIILIFTGIIFWHRRWRIRDRA